MNKALLLVWEESEENKISPDGASLHIDNKVLNEFLKSHNEKLPKKLPKVYSRVVGTYTEVIISESLFGILSSKKNLRLKEYEFNNLVQFKEIYA